MRMPTAGTAGFVFTQLVAIALVYAVGLVIAAAGLFVLLVSDGGGDTAPSSTGVLVYEALLVLIALGSTHVALRVVGDSPAWWRVISALALMIAVTGIVAFVGMIGVLQDWAAAAPVTADHGRDVFAPVTAHLAGGDARRLRTSLPQWFDLAVLRIMLAPMAAAIFLQVGLRAPNRLRRIQLLVAAASEAIVLATTFTGKLWLK